MSSKRGYLPGVRSTGVGEERIMLGCDIPIIMPDDLFIIGQQLAGDACFSPFVVDPDGRSLGWLDRVAKRSPCGLLRGGEAGIHLVVPLGPGVVTKVPPPVEVESCA